ncbi:hypothetical protein B0H14DRAFT_3886341, partial [Mycena olivaceomarginata]
MTRVLLLIIHPLCTDAPRLALLPLPLVPERQLPVERDRRDVLRTPVLQFLLPRLAATVAGRLLSLPAPGNAAPGTRDPIR